MYFNITWQLYFCHYSALDLNYGKVDKVYCVCEKEPICGHICHRHMSECQPLG